VSDPFIGEIRIFGFNFAPRGWALCQGQLLPINQNTALYSLLGTYYGGNGTSTFALPDLRSRFPLSFGDGPGLTHRDIGEAGGADKVTLSVSHLPAHHHPVNANDTATSLLATAAGHVPGKISSYAESPDGTTVMNEKMIGDTGGGQSFSILPPFLALNFCIALQGIYPPRN
jgi:microcystin-dependent protein